MKAMLLAPLAVLIGSAALANDGGTPYINVKAVQSRIKSGDVVKIKGGDAYKLYQVLPQDYVFDVSRSLLINGPNKSVTISCGAQPVKGTDENPVPDKATTECTVSINSRYVPQPEENAWEWEGQTCHE